MKTISKKSIVIICVLGLWGCPLILHASPTDDLASPSQDIRDAAAKILRETYVPPPRTNWDVLVSALKIGTPQAIIENQLQSSNLLAGGGLSSGNTEVKSYRLDDLWMLNCSFTNAFSNITSIEGKAKRSSESIPVISMSSFTNGSLARIELQERLQEVWVEPPTNFTGIWKTYSVNGQASHEFHYKNGQPEGLLTTFYPDGSKCVVSPLHNGVPDGVELGYHPSGKVAYKGTYKAGKQIGHWIWYKKDGSIESEKDYDPK